jgi:hypothetical protein
MSAREQRTPAVGSCKPRVVTAELSPAQYDGGALLRAKLGLPELSIRGISSEVSWHRAIKALKTSEYLARQ